MSTGSTERARIPLTVPDIGPEEEAAVLAVMRSGMLVQGPAVAAFEEGIATRADRRHGIAVSSGTAALSLALEVLGVGPGDEVLVPALTWVSPAHAVQCRGAKVVLVDVDPAEWNASAEAFAAARTPKTKTAIIIDQFGMPVRNAAIQGALDGLALVEDAACALGSSFADGRPCGSLGALSCFSFHPRKVLTTGEGGVITTDDDALAARLRILRNHGQRGPGDFAEPAVNYRLGEMAGAMGKVQLGKLDGLLASRRAHAAVIQEGLSDVLTFQKAPAGATPNQQTLGALLPEGTDKAAFIARMAERQVQIGALSYDLSQVASVGSDRGGNATPVAADIAARGVTLPLYSTMTAQDIDRVIEGVRATLRS